MKIVADENIPFVKELFSPLGDVVLKSGREITKGDVFDAKILLVRSVTKVNEALLAGSEVEFVGTCTIGCDHLDSCYLDANKIAYSSAPGCNANSVVQYVISVLASFDELQTGKSVVVVGGGNVGSRVHNTLSALGFDCRCVDPFLSSDSGLNLSNFSAVFDADIVCLHAPYTEDGPYPTRHMFSQDELAKLKPGVLFINAGRGGVVDNNALLAFKKINPDLRLVLDVWENEPNIDKELLALTNIGTPHIAGYSFEGRVTGSLMIFDALSQYLDVPHEQVVDIRGRITDKAFENPIDVSAPSLKEVLLAIYNVNKDYVALKAASDSVDSSFDKLRKNYPIRREFSHYKCPSAAADIETYRTLGFVFDD